METGARLEAVLGASGGSMLRVAPRLSARYALGGGMTVSGSLARTYQDAQALTPAGPEAGPIALAGLFWVLPSDSVPALRADLAFLGVERWLGTSTLLSLGTYARHTLGVLSPDPHAGWLHQRPVWRVSKMDARGAEVEVRRLAGAVTASLAYSFTHAELTTDGRPHPAPAGRRHGLDLAASVRPTSGLQLTAAFTAASGAPFTRYTAAAAVCPGSEHTSCGVRVYGRSAGAARGRAYRSLDLRGEWSAEVRRLDLSAWLQLHNVLRRSNRAAYLASSTFCVGERCDPFEEPDPSVTSGGHDRFLPGLPFLPAAGVRIRF